MASANDMKAANATYAGFISKIKIFVPIILAITAIVVLLIAS